MRHHTLVSFMAGALALLMFIPGCDDIRWDLQDTLDQVIEAERAGDGDTMVRLIDPINHAHYDRVVEVAKRADYFEIRHMPAVDRYRVAAIRASVTGAELRTLDGRGMVRLRTTSRWNARERMPQITLGRINHRSPRATAELLVFGEPSGVHVEFVKVEGRWLFNDQAFDEMFNKLVAEEARRQNRSEDFIVLNLASRATRKNFDNRIWDGPPR